MERRRILRNATVIVESAVLWGGLAAISLWLDTVPGAWAKVALVVSVVAHGFWLYRIYMIGHEAGHRKLFTSRIANDVIGQIAVLPILMPMRVFRKIHVFHHAYNRRDAETSALDTFIVRVDSQRRRVLAYCVWILAVFGGGFFLHSLVSVVLFLTLPLGIAQRVSPAFRGWRARDRWISIAELLLAVGFHAVIALVLGTRSWLLITLLPMLAFAWIYSVFVYIYHYRTSYGRPTHYNVRALRASRVFSWWLLNFNEHATHHANPALPWYELAERRIELPPSHRAQNQQVETVAQSVLFLFQGPNVVRRPP